MKKLSEVTLDGQPKLIPPWVWVDKDAISERIGEEVQKALAVLEYTGQIEDRDKDEESIHQMFWGRAEEHKNTKGLYMDGHFALLLGGNWLEMQGLKAHVCKYKGLGVPSCYEMLWGERSGNGWSVTKGGISQETLDGSGEIAAIFVPFNAAETGYDKILFANGEGTLPYDDYANKKYHDSEYPDTQVAFAARVEEAYGFKLLSHVAYDALWTKEALTATNCRDSKFLLNRGWVRSGRRYSVGGDDSVVSCVCSVVGRPYAGKNFGRAGSDSGEGVAFVDGV